MCIVVIIYTYINIYCTMCSRVLHGILGLSCRSDSDDAIRDLLERREKQTGRCLLRRDRDLGFLRRGRNAPRIKHGESFYAETNDNCALIVRWCEDRVC